MSQAVRYLAQVGVHFAIRSGGHSPAPFGANINDGVLFDMSGFNSVEYDPRRGAAVVGTGMRWGDVYRHLDQYNVTVVGGRILQVGVGGLTLGSRCSLPTPATSKLQQALLIFFLQVGCPISPISTAWSAIMSSILR